MKFYQLIKVFFIFCLKESIEKTVKKLFLIDLIEFHTKNFKGVCWYAKSLYSKTKPHSKTLTDSFSIVEVEVSQNFLLQVFQQRTLVVLFEMLRNVRLNPGEKAGGRTSQLLGINAVCDVIMISL